MEKGEKEGWEWRDGKGGMGREGWEGRDRIRREGWDGRDGKAGMIRKGWEEMVWEGKDGMG